jgi:hypothetical protein
LKIDPSKLGDIMSYQNNRESLLKALDHLKFSKASALVIISSPKKFLWVDLLKFFEGKTDQLIRDCIMILSKMEVLSDPGA